ncbi:MAG: S1C family serine protease [Rudaea sp.]
MEKHNVSRWLVVLVILGVLVGVAGGAVMGGAAGYYVALNRAPAAASAAAAAQPQLASAVSPAQAPATTNLSVTENSAVIDTVQKASPAVVTVISTLAGSSGSGRFQQQPFGPNTPSGIAEGSGVIIDAQGHIVTNQHVIDSAQKIEVVFSDGSRATAKLVGSDSLSDLAVLQVSGKVPAFLSLGDSSALQLGETVIAIGSPLGSYRGSVTVGVVSGVNRSVQGADQEGLIQTDAAINHGNSGGPLLNLAGQVIGINTLVVQNTNNGDIAEGLGFAIPSNIVSAVSKQLIAGGKVQYPFVGVTYQPVTPESASVLNLTVQSGVLVSQVTSGSPASKAGIQQNDVITAIDGVKIDESHSLRSILFQHKPGDKVTMTVLRGSQTLSLQVTLAARPDQTSAGAPG